jgi:class 3 adenylate cyclase
LRAPTSLTQHNGLAFISSIAKCALDAQPNAIGEQVGMAQRMESVAPPGGVMLADGSVLARRLLGMGVCYATNFAARVTGNRPVGKSSDW